MILCRKIYLSQGLLYVPLLINRRYKSFRASSGRLSLVLRTYIFSFWHLHCAFPNDSFWKKEGKNLLVLNNPYILATAASCFIGYWEIFWFKQHSNFRLFYLKKKPHTFWCRVLIQRPTNFCLEEEADLADPCSQLQTLTLIYSLFPCFSTNAEQLWKRFMNIVGWGIGNPGQKAEVFMCGVGNEISFTFTEYKDFKSKHWHLICIEGILPKNILLENSKYFSSWTPEL